MKGAEMKRGLKFVVFLILSTSATFAYSQGIMISGKVLSKDSGEALIGTHVLIQDKWSLGTTTSLNGSFQLNDELIETSDTLIFSFIGFQEKVLPVSHFANGAKTVYLTELAGSMEEVVVAAEKLISEEFSVEKVNKLEIYMNPNAKADPLLAVNSMAAATTTDESANISLRGSSPAETGIFFDNVPIYDAVRFSQLNGIGTFSIFNTSIVNNIQVFPGNPPLEYGNTSAGLIAIQSDESIPKKRVNSAVISLASLGFNTKGKTGKEGVLNIFTNVGLSAGLTSINEQALRDLKKFNSWDVGLHYYSKIGEKLRIKIFNYSLLESYDFAFRSPSFMGTFRQRKRRNFTVANLRYRQGASEITLNQGFSVSKSNFGYSLTDIDLTNTDVYTSVNYQYHGTAWSIKSGLTFDQRKVDFDGTFPQFDFAVGPEHPFTSNRSSNTVSAPEFYVYTKYYINKRWTAGAGYRKNMPKNNEKAYWSGQFNVSFNPSNILGWHLSAGRYHKVDLGPEGSDQLIESHQISLDQSIKNNRIEQHLAVFAKRTKLGLLETSIFGAEFYLEYRFGSRFSGSIAYTYIGGSVESSSKTNPSPYDMNYFVKGNLQYKFPGNWTLTSVFVLREGQYYGPLEGANFRQDLQVFEPDFESDALTERYPSYRLVDASISKLLPINENFTMVIFGSVGNIFNFKNTRSYRYNSDYSKRRSNYFSQRTIYFGAIINF